MERNFARLGEDWRHTNDMLYQASDNSLYVSCREAFLVKLDYDSGAIRWILGDNTKFWEHSPSLTAKALTVSADQAPIGQHSVSIASDGSLMLFNNGFASRSMPENESAGASRSFSMAQKFAIDEVNMTATETWRYDADETIYSGICSSIQEQSDGLFLVNFSSAENRTKSIFHLINTQGDVKMSLTLPTTNCAASWKTSSIDISHITHQ